MQMAYHGIDNAIGGNQSKGNRGGFLGVIRKDSKVNSRIVSSLLLI